MLVQNTEQQCSPEMTTAPDAASCLMLLQAECCQQNACSHGCNAHRLHARVFTCILSEKKRKDYALRRQFNEKPNIILGCPGMHPFTPGLYCRVPSVHPALLHSLGRLLRSGQRMWAVTGTLTGRFSTWPSAVATLMKPSRYNTHQKDAKSWLLHFMLHCLVSTA